MLTDKGLNRRVVLRTMRKRAAVSI
jgi:hypothetical protein